MPAKPSPGTWNPGAIGTEGARAAYLLAEGSGTTANDLSPNARHATLSGVTWNATGAYTPNLTLAPTSRGVANGAAFGAPSFPIWSAVLLDHDNGGVDHYLAFHGRNDSDLFVGLRWAAGGFNYYLYDGTNFIDAGVVSGSELPNVPVFAMTLSTAANDHRLYLTAAVPGGTLTPVATSSTTLTPFAANTFGLTGIERAAFGNTGHSGKLYALATGAGSYPDPTALATDWLNGTFTFALGSAGGGFVSAWAAYSNQVIGMGAVQ